MAATRAVHVLTTIPLTDARGKTDVARELMLWPGARDYYRVGAGHRYLAVRGGVLSTSSPPVHKSNCRGASHGLHAIDATPARWRGGVVSYRSIQPSRPIPDSLIDLRTGRRTTSTSGAGSTPP